MWVDGQASGDLPVSDRGLNYADGVFETMRIAAGSIPLLEMHLQRLQSGCERLVDYMPRVVIAEAGTGAGQCRDRGGSGQAGADSRQRWPRLRAARAGSLPAHHQSASAAGLSPRSLHARCQRTTLRNAARQQPGHRWSQTPGPPRAGARQHGADRGQRRRSDAQPDRRDHRGHPLQPVSCPRQRAADARCESSVASPV